MDLMKIAVGLVEQVGSTKYYGKPLASCGIGRILLSCVTFDGGRDARYDSKLEEYKSLSFFSSCRIYSREHA